MNLIIDIGNTETKIGFFNHDKLIKTHRHKVFTWNEAVRLFHVHKNVECAILSTVVDHDEELEEYLKEKCVFKLMSPKLSLPLKNTYKTPNTLGMDRLASAAGAYSIFPGKNVLVIDAGTCIKYELVNSNGEYLGGAISPGLEMRFKSLHHYTRKLPKVTAEGMTPLIGRNTQDSIRSGVVNGLIHEVKGCIADYKKLYPQLNIISSGGNVGLLSRAVKKNLLVEPDLVLIGLNAALIHNLN